MLDPLMKKILITKLQNDQRAVFMKLLMTAKIAIGLRASKDVADSLVRDPNQVIEIEDEYFTAFVSGLEQMEIDYKAVD